jgi:hypothetical protein
VDQSSRLIVTPELVQGDGTQIYVRARVEGAGAVPMFAIDVMMRWYADAEAPTFPAGFKYSGTRDMRLNKSEDASFQVYRFIWSPPRPPLFFDMEEPITEAPILVRRQNLLNALFVVHTMAPLMTPETHAYTIGAQGQAIEVSANAELVPGSFTPAYRTKR